MPPAGMRKIKRGRAENFRPTHCRLATDWRSGRTPAEPCPPASTRILAQPAARSQAPAPTTAGGTHALNSGVWGRAPGQPCVPILKRQEIVKIHPLDWEKSLFISGNFRRGRTGLRASLTFALSTADPRCFNPIAENWRKSPPQADAFTSMVPRRPARASTTCLPGSGAAAEPEASDPTSPAASTAPPPVPCGAASPAIGHRWSAGTRPPS